MNSLQLCIQRFRGTSFNRNDLPFHHQGSRFIVDAGPFPIYIGMIVVCGRNSSHPWCHHLLRLIRRCLQPVAIRELFSRCAWPLFFSRLSGPGPASLFRLNSRPAMSELIRYGRVGPGPYPALFGRHLLHCYERMFDRIGYGEQEISGYHHLHRLSR
jgi:hypothetical protein